MRNNYRLLLYVFLGAVFLTGCLSTEGARQQFRQVHDFRIGSYIENIPLPVPNGIVYIQNDLAEYSYVFFNAQENSDCIFTYVVDVNSGKVLEWKYQGVSEACYQTLKLGTPW